MKEKPQLNKAIRSRLSALKQTQKEFAYSQRIDHDVFRAQLMRNTYSAHILSAAANLLTNGNTTKLEKMFVFRESKRKGGSMLLPTQSLREQVGRTIKAPPSELTQDIQRLYSWLGPSDLAVICSLNLPAIEATPTGWLQLETSLVKAVTEGTAFVYIRPNEAVIRQQAEVLPDFFSKRTPRDEYEELQENLLSAVGPGAKENVQRNVKLIEVEWCPFWAIGMRFGFYSASNADEERRDMTLFARFPFGGRFSGDDSADSKLLLFADQTTKNAFHSYLIQIFAGDKDLRPLLSRLR